MPGTENYNGVRLRTINRPGWRSDGTYVLYWTQIYRRLERNHALNYAIAVARRLRRPLVVYEGLKLGYPWASRRLHRFILEGMIENQAAARRLGINYWPFVETPEQPGRGLLRKLAAKAAAVVTDDFPCFIIPDQTEALARATETPVVAVDGNSVVPIAHYGPVVSAAAHLRPRLHRLFLEAWNHRAGKSLKLDDAVCRPIDPPFELWHADDLDRFLASLPLDGVPPARATHGGATEARTRLAAFVRRRLKGYADQRSTPTAPEEGHASGLSPYLHFGHISIEEVVEAVFAASGFDPEALAGRKGGRREGFFGDDADVNSFLDEALTWRDLGFHWHWTRRADAKSLETSLPSWAWATLRKHAGDPRPHAYSLEEFEGAATHDDLWNAAQRELVVTGTIQNYLRMLWGKKVLEWSKTPDEAYRTLEHLNNKYALDGRNPNSYTGILWCFGLFDRPWAPERSIFGSVRYMSSENTARKFKVGRYLEYVKALAEK